MSDDVTMTSFNFQGESADGKEGFEDFFLMTSQKRWDIGDEDKLSPVKFPGKIQRG